MYQMHNYQLHGNMWCVAVCCGVLRCVCDTSPKIHPAMCVAVCCSVLRCVAVTSPKIHPAMYQMHHYQLYFIYIKRDQSL